VADFKINILPASREYRGFQEVPGTNRSFGHRTPFISLARILSWQEKNSFFLAHKRKFKNAIKTIQSNKGFWLS
jgi:hypothetical protein